MALSAKSHRPRAPRVVATPRGEVFDGATWSKVLIQDISECGVLMICTQPFESGQTLGLRLLPSANEFIDCTIEVRHSNKLATGAMIVSMDKKYRQAYDRYLRHARILDENRGKKASGKASPPGAPRAPRADATLRGEVFDGAVGSKVLIQDISDSGVLMICTRQFDPGKTLGLRFLLNAGNSIDCTVEVRHSNELGTGAMIVFMDEKYRSAYDQHLRDVLRRSGK